MKAPPDPYTGKPLLYRATGDGVVVYSVSGDLTDDGGEVGPWRGGGSDLGVRLWHPARRGWPADAPDPPGD